MSKLRLKLENALVNPYILPGILSFLYIGLRFFTNSLYAETHELNNEFYVGDFIFIWIMTYIVFLMPYALYSSIKLLGSPGTKKSPVATKDTEPNMLQQSSQINPFLILGDSIGFGIPLLFFVLLIKGWYDDLYREAGVLVGLFFFGVFATSIVGYTLFLRKIILRFVNGSKRP